MFKGHLKTISIEAILFILIKQKTPASKSDAGVPHFTIL